MNLMTLLKPKGEIEYLHKEDTLRQGLERMRIYGYTALPVIDEDGCYAGSVNEGDFLWYMLTYHKCDMQELESFQTLFWVWHLYCRQGFFISTKRQERPH